MKKLYEAFGEFMGGRKTYGPTEHSQSSPVTITSYSQPHVLQSRMKEEKMTHGQTVRATLSPVRLEMTPYGTVVMYFCPMKSLQVHEVIAGGDGRSLPAQAIIEGLEIPADCKSGLYELMDVELTSNGTMQVRATDKTAWKFVDEATPREAHTIM